MKLIIDIADDQYKAVQDGMWCGSLYEELKKGIPLEQCGDCISREETLRTLMDEWTEYNRELIGWLFEKIDKLPSATPQPKMGRWIDVDGIWFKCSECDAHRKMMPAYKEYYCPNCGAKMQEVEE